MPKGIKVLKKSFEVIKKGEAGFDVKPQDRIKIKGTTTAEETVVHSRYTKEDAVSYTHLRAHET